MNEFEKSAMTVAAEFRKQSRKLFGDRVMLVLDPGDTHIGMIELPNAVRKQSGTIVMVGVDVDTAKHDVKIGDRVLFTRYEPTEGYLERLDGAEVAVAMMHIADLYVGWDDAELRGHYIAECMRLEVPEYVPGYAYEIK